MDHTKVVFNDHRLRMNENFLSKWKLNSKVKNNFWVLYLHSQVVLFLSFIIFLGGQLFLGKEFSKTSDFLKSNNLQLTKRKFEGNKSYQLTFIN